MTRPDAPCLVADIGGTNTRVALARGPVVDTTTVQRYRNGEHDSLTAVLRTYLASQGDPDCAGACVAMAGPVHDGRGTLTNLDWEVDRASVASAARAGTSAVLNDLQAQGHALGVIDDSSLRQVLPGSPDARGARLVIGVGTGFNAVCVHDLDGGRHVPPAESGHVTLPVRTEADLRLATYVEVHHGYAAVEDVLSGRGLAHVHRWLSDEAGTKSELSPAEVMQSIGRDALADRAVQVFSLMLGRVAGDLALHHLPFGGVYLVGGVARAVMPHMGDHFASAFRDKGRFSTFMDQFPVAVIEDDFAALTGCASHLAELMSRA